MPSLRDSGCCTELLTLRKMIGSVEMPIILRRVSKLIKTSHLYPSLIKKDYNQI
jgi:hypothetical protein